VGRAYGFKERLPLGLGGRTIWHVKKKTFQGKKQRILLPYDSASKSANFPVGRMGGETKTVMRGKKIR